MRAFNAPSAAACIGVEVSDSAASVRVWSATHAIISARTSGCAVGCGSTLLEPVSVSHVSHSALFEAVALVATSAAAAAGAFVAAALGFEPFGALRGRWLDFWYAS